MKKRKKNLKGIIILFILIIIMLLCACKLIETKGINYVEDKDNIKYINLNDQESLKEDIIIPSNSIDFFKNYYGKLESKQIYEDIDKFAKKILPKYINELRNNEINEYYDLNVNVIKKELGIENIETFEKFVNKINNITENNFIAKTIEFDKEKVFKKENGTTAILIIEYNNNIKIEIDIYIPNENNKQNIMFY